MSDMTCSVEGCDRPRSAHGFCAAHFQRMRRGQPIEDTGIREYVEGGGWKIDLDPFALLWEAFETGVELNLRLLSDEELRSLQFSLRHPTQGNCRWGAYRVVPHLAAAIEREWGQRIRATERQS